MTETKLRSTVTERIAVKKIWILRYVQNPWVALAIVIVAAFWLRVHNLDRLSLWIDEGITVWKVKQPFSHLFFLNRIDTVPPLYYYLLKIWLFVVGEDDFRLRLFSASIGAATCGLTYFIGKTLMDRQSALAAAALVALSALHIQYSQEARSYALLVFLFGLALYFLCRIPRHSNRASWIGYVISGVLLLYTHGLSVVYLAVLNLFFLSNRAWWDRKTLVSLTAANSLILGCFLPWLSVYIEQIASFQNQTTLPQPGWNEVFSTLVMLASFPPPDSRFLPPELRSFGPQLIPLIQGSWMLGFVLLFFAPAFSASHHHQRSIPALYLLFLSPFVVIFGFSLLLKSIYVDRLFVVCVLPLCLLLASNLDRTSRTARIASVWLGLYVFGCIFCIYTYYLRNWKEDYRGATSFLAKNANFGDVLVFVAHAGELHFDWYSRGLRPDLIKVGLPESIYKEPEPDLSRFIRKPMDFPDLQKRIDRSGKHFWLLKSHSYNFDPKGLADKWLDTHLTRQGIVEFPGIQIIDYRDADRPSSAEPSQGSKQQPLAPFTLAKSNSKRQ